GQDGHWSAPGLEQAVELSLGILPREVTSLDQIASPAARAMWPTPAATDWKGSSKMGQRRGQLSEAAALGGQLNPTWVEWLMGFPLGWTDLEPSETPSS